MPSKLPEATQLAKLGLEPKLFGPTAYILTTLQMLVIKDPVHRLQEKTGSSLRATKPLQGKKVALICLKAIC